MIELGRVCSIYINDDAKMTDDERKEEEFVCFSINVNGVVVVFVGFNRTAVSV